MFLPGMSKPEVFGSRCLLYVLRRNLYSSLTSSMAGNEVCENFVLEPVVITIVRACRREPTRLLCCKQAKMGLKLSTVTGRQDYRLTEISECRNRLSRDFLNNAPALSLSAHLAQKRKLPLDTILCRGLWVVVTQCGVGSPLAS